MSKQIIFLIGKLCSGKTTFAHNCAVHTPINVSDIVRNLTGESRRSKLQDTIFLDNAIINELWNILVKVDPMEVIVVGIRQKSILSAFIERLSPEKYEIIYLDVPDEELKRRYNKRQDNKDDQTWEEAMEKDNKLGLQELIDYVTKDLHCTVINNY